MAATFGKYIRRIREERRTLDADYSLRKLAARIGVQPSYLSKVERDEEPPPSEEKILRLAAELDQDSEVLLAMAGKVSSELRAIIMRRPALFSKLIHQLRDLPDDAILRLVREVRDGDW